MSHVNKLKSKTYSTILLKVVNQFLKRLKKCHF